MTSRTLNIHASLRPQPAHPQIFLPRILAEGTTRMMTGACMGGEIFQKNNECRAGEVTPAVYSPRLERSIGFILADLAYATVGTRQRVETPGVIALSR